jgi:hypothetical protein
MLEGERDGCGEHHVSLKNRSGSARERIFLGYPGIMKYRRKVNNV